MSAVLGSEELFPNEGVEILPYSGTVCLYQRLGFAGVGGQEWVISRDGACSEYSGHSG